MLSSSDLLINTFDDTNGKSVIRYNAITFTPTEGTVDTGDHGLTMGQGLAVGLDNTFYVSSPFSGGVLHYDINGDYLGILGSGTLAVPGTLAIGPDDGHLYVADINAATIYQFDTTTETIVDSDFLGYAPAGFSFVPDGTNDLVVGGFDTQGVVRYTSGGPVTLIAPGSGINPLALLALADGDVLIADSDLGFEPSNHHQIMRYDSATQTTSQFINLTQPLGANNEPPQPTSLLMDPEGNLLVGLAPDHNLTGAVQKFDIDTGAYLGTLVSNIGSPAGMAYIDSVASAVAGRKLFYRNSPKWNVTNNNLPGFSDDNAIAPDKSAYLPLGTTSSFSNVSNYTRGINGIMVDLAGPHGPITANDFIFKVGNNNSPGSWSTATGPTTVTVRSEAGTGGSDRIELIWADGAIINTWLEVIVRGNDALGGSNTNTGLPTSDVFYFGSAPADSGSGNATGYLVNSTDEMSARNDPHGIGNPATITNVNDFDRNGSVQSADQMAARNNSTSFANQLKFLSVGPGGPFAPQSASNPPADADRSAVGFALASAGAANTVPTSRVDVSAPATMQQAAPAVSAPPRGGAAMETAASPPAEDDQAANVDEEDVVLDSLLAELGLD